MGGYCDVVFGVWDFYVGYSGVVVGVLDSCVGYWCLRFLCGLQWCSGWHLGLLCDGTRM